MNPTAGSPPEAGAPLRGLALTAGALLVGIVVLAAVGRNNPGPEAVASSTATTTTLAAPATTTTTTPPTHSPSTVKVLVANGTSTKGLAGKEASRLRSQGYDTLSPTDTNSPAQASAVYFQTGFQGDADAIASMLGLAVSSVQPLGTATPVSSNSAQVVVVVGPDLAGGSASSSSSSGQTSSNATTSTTSGSSNSSTSTTG